MARNSSSNIPAVQFYLSVQVNIFETWES